MTAPTYTTDAEAVAAILAEVARARRKHPAWPADIIHQAAIVAEEAGELVRASLDTVYFYHPTDERAKEAIHTAATAIRLLRGE